MRDVHLPSPFGGEDFLRLLPMRSLPGGYPDPFTSEATSIVEAMCRSITFNIDGATPAGTTTDTDTDSELTIGYDCESDSPRNALSTLLYMVTTLEYLPNLRHISLKYTDWGYGDIFEQLEEAVFPPQVTHLSIDYSFSAPEANYFKSLYRRNCPARVTVPTVRHLSLSGVPPEFIADMLQVCTEVETLEIVGPACLYALSPLPASVRTLILRHPGPRLTSKEMYWWMLAHAMEGGLVRADSRVRIVVRSGTPHPGLFTDLKRCCKSHGAVLVYERDESCSM